MFKLTKKLKTVSCAILMGIVSTVAVAEDPNTLRPYADDADTVALWHIDDNYGGRYLYNDAGVTGFDRRIFLDPHTPFTGPVRTNPATTPGLDFPAGNIEFGHCLHFNGVDQLAYAPFVGGTEIDESDVSIEGWFNPDVATDGQKLFCSWGMMGIFTGSTKLSVQVWDGVGTPVYDFDYAPLGINPSGEWIHFAVDVIGTEMKVYLNGESAGAPITLAGALLVPTKPVHIGKRYNSTQMFTGYIDEIRVAKASVIPSHHPAPPTPNLPYLDDLGTQALWHMNTITSNKYVYNDASVTGLDQRIQLSPNGDPYLGPPLVDPAVTPGLDFPGGNNTDFGKCMYFDGTTTSALNVNGGVNTITDWSDARVELWFNADNATDGQSLFDSWGQFRIKTHSGKITVQVWDGIGTPTYDFDYAPLGIAPNGVWTHVAVDVVDLTMYVYINGANVGTHTLAGPVSPTSTKNLYVGQRYTGSERFTGYIDEVRVGKASIPGTHAAVPPAPPTPYLPYLDDEGTAALWHVDGNHGNRYLYNDATVTGFDRRIFLSPHDPYTGPERIDPATIPGLDFPAGNNQTFGHCLHFNGVDQDAYAPFVGAAEIDPTDVRVEVWFNADNATDGQKIFGSWGMFGIFTGSTTLSVQVWEGASVPTYNFDYAPLGIDPNEVWTHVAVSVVDTEMRVYLNGDLVGAPITLSGPLGSPTKPVHIGKRYNGSNKFTGYIDEVRVAKASIPGTHSPVTCGDWGYFDGDVNQNCYVDKDDVSAIADGWLGTIADGESGVQDDYQNLNIGNVAAGTTPSIDGTLSPGEWLGAKIITMIAEDLATPPNVGSWSDSDASDGTGPPTAADFTGKFYFKWDNTYLYFGYKTIDDVFVGGDAADSYPLTPGYPNDHVLLAIDPNNQIADVTQSMLFEMGEDKDGNTFIVIRTDQGVTLNLDNSVFDSSVNTGILNTTVQFEGAVKWTDLGVSGPGAEIGLGILIGDNDDNDGVRDTLSTSAGNMTIPSQWHDITLTAEYACGDNGYHELDVDRSCAVDLGDVALVAIDWMKCTEPTDGGCVITP